MHESDLLLVGAYILRITVTIAGIVFAYLGYRLFVLGVLSPSGDVEAIWGNNKLLLKRASPGIFFALLGAIIIIAALFYHPSITTSESPDGTRHSSKGGVASI
jgi:hypothetical protein